MQLSKVVIGVAEFGNKLFLIPLRQCLRVRETFIPSIKSATPEFLQVRPTRLATTVANSAGSMGLGKCS